MRTLTHGEIERVSGGIDAISVGGINITGIEAGLALRNVLGAVGVAYGVGYGAGLVFNTTWQGVSGDSFGTDLYQTAHS